LLRDNDLPDHERRFVVSVASSALAGLGRARQAIALTKEHSEAENRDANILLIAAAQSEADDVVGALQTAELLPEGIGRQRTLMLTAVRQAQFGDFEDAVDLLNRVTDSGQQDRGLELTIHEYLKVGSFREATELSGRIRSAEIRDRVKRHTKRIHEKPVPGDFDFTERTVQQARTDWGFIGFSEDDAEFLRLKCRAEIAIHEKDSKSFQQAMGDALQWIKNWGPKKRRTALLDLAVIYRRFGDDASAHQAFREGLTGYLNQRDRGFDIDFVRIALASGEYLNNVVELMPREEVEELVSKMVSSDNHNDLLAGLSTAAVRCGKIDIAERTFGMLRTTDQRFRVSAAVCGALAKTEYPE
jgi:hypothetical protein